MVLQTSFDMFFAGGAFKGGVGVYGHDSMMVNLAVFDACSDFLWLRNSTQCHISRWFRSVSYSRESSAYKV